MDHLTKSKYTPQMIKHMPYQDRLRHYHEEKNALFEKIRDMSAADVRDAHDVLIQKWQI